MTNSEYIRLYKILDNKIAQSLDIGNCRICKARKKCKERYPQGVNVDFDCKKFIRMAEKREKQ